MGKLIAVSGKGGVGKTAVATLIILYLAKKDGVSILGIDADPDTNLPEAIGQEINKTVGDVREDFQKDRSSFSASTDKALLLEYKIMGILSEGERYDLIAMGRSEGPGCYCAVNHQLREIIDVVTKNYDFTVIDAEAGLEHLSRRTIRDVDLMFIVTDPSKKGLHTAKRIKKLADEVDIRCKKTYLIANKIKTEDEQVKLNEYVNELGLEMIGSIPFDDKIESLDFDGKPLINLPDDDPGVQAIENIMRKTL
jgi:CO dehydrogenase maturation factor